MERGRRRNMAKLGSKPTNKKSATSSNGAQPVKKNHYTTVKMASCKICGRESTGYHFGVVTCEACKAFFRRAISKDSKISENCREGNFRCGDNLSRITGCPACRLQRCKDLGMSKGGARKGRYSLQLRTQSILDAKLEQEKLQQLKQEEEQQQQQQHHHHQQQPNHHQHSHHQELNHNQQNHLQEQQNHHQELGHHHQQHQQQNHQQQHHLPFPSPSNLSDQRLSPYSDHTDHLPEPFHPQRSPSQQFEPIHYNNNHFVPQDDQPHYRPQYDSYPSAIDYSDSNGYVNENDCGSSLPSSDLYSAGPMDLSLPTVQYDTISSPERLKTNWILSGSNQIPSGFKPSSSMKADGSYDEEKITVNDMRPEELSPIIYEESINYDNLIGELVELRERLFPHRRDTTNIQKRHKEIEEEHRHREEAYQFMFGVKRADYVSPKEFSEVLFQVNIELDDRLKVLRDKAIDNEKNIVQYIQHSRHVPGFHTLHLDDILELLKASYFEFWLFSNYIYFNDKTGVSGGSEAVVNGHKKMISSLFPKDYVDATFGYTETLKRLNLTQEEVAIIRVIILTFADRCTLKHPNRVENLQNVFIRCLLHEISKHVEDPRPRFCLIMDRLIEIRSLTHMNVEVNKVFLRDWSFLLEEFPLWREMIIRKENL